MIIEQATSRRDLRSTTLAADLVVVGGGLAGVCAAITAARQGIQVILVQDRPVLGGNASSEVRLWTLGATSHMGSNSRWAREGGVIDEILTENMWRNPESNPIIFDTVVLEKTIEESNITLLLNTAAYAITKNGESIASVTAFCSQNSTEYTLTAPLFCDASGDGILGFLAGAAFRMGAEKSDEFGEKFAPTQEYGELLGHSIYFYSKDVGKPVAFVPPAFALKDVEGTIPRYRSFNAKTDGCRLWWIEWGGRLDTVHETETIKWELWKVVYGVWDYIKNSGKFPEADTLTLEWVGHVPGKRESRRFEGDYMIRQQDIIEQKHFDDAVAFGGWAIDLHPSDGVFSEKPGCTQWHPKGIYQIPYRCSYSQNIPNLFIAGRLLSASHVAFGSTRVMATGAHSAQAVGIAAAIATESNLLPRTVPIKELQTRLLRTGQHIPGYRLEDADDLAQLAQITATSSLMLGEMSAGADRANMDIPRANLLPLPAGAAPVVTYFADVEADATLRAELIIGNRRTATWANTTPDTPIAEVNVPVKAGHNVPIRLDFGNAILPTEGFAFVMLHPCEGVQVHLSDARITGVLGLRKKNLQKPDSDIGVETFERWAPDRRPQGKPLACTIAPPLDCFSPANVTNGILRPVNLPNAWVADATDKAPALTLTWDTEQTIARIVIGFDCDWDHPMESTLYGHPERAMPFCVRNFKVYDDANNLLHEATTNHLSQAEIRLPQPITTRALRIECLESWNENAPASLLDVRAYAS